MDKGRQKNVRTKNTQLNIHLITYLYLLNASPLIGPEAVVNSEAICAEPKLQKQP